MDTPKILVVEDESVVAFDIEEGLKSQGYNVAAVVGTGEEGIAKAEALRPDLVLMDIRLRGEMDGISAAAHVKDHLGIPVVFLTAYADEATLQRAKIAEPYGYILKPFEEIELRTTIELALHRYNLHGNKEPQKRGVTPTSTTTSKVPKDFSADTTPYEFLKRIPPFGTLPDRQLRSLADSCHFSAVKSGDLIAYEGEENASSFIVVSGRVAMLKTSLNGKELIVELLPPGDLFSLIVALQKTPYPLTARAQIESKVLWIPSSMFMLVLDQHPELYKSFTEQMSSRLRTSHDLARGLAHDRVEVRIASTLCALIPKFASEDQKEETYTIIMTRQEVADLTGTTPETAIRTTKAMEREELLDLSKPGVIKVIDLEGLMEIAESE